MFTFNPRESRVPEPTKRGPTLAKLEIGAPISLIAAQCSTKKGAGRRMFKGFDLLCQGSAELLARALCVLAVLWLAVVWAI